jgi:hypothetical protein
MVHVPRFCHPLFAPAALAPYMNMFLPPANAGVKNVIAAFTVNALATCVTVVPSSEIEHWVFESVKLVVGVRGVLHPVPASFRR